MTLDEQKKLYEAVRKIPCELATATSTSDGKCAWTSCRECARCLLLNVLNHADPLDSLGDIMKLPDNGGLTARR